MYTVSDLKYNLSGKKMKLFLAEIILGAKAHPFLLPNVKYKKYPYSISGAFYVVTLGFESSHLMHLIYM